MSFVWWCPKLHQYSRWGCTSVQQDSHFLSWLAVLCLHSGGQLIFLAAGAHCWLAVQLTVNQEPQIPFSRAALLCFISQSVCVAELPLPRCRIWYLFLLNLVWSVQLSDLKVLQLKYSTLLNKIMRWSVEHIYVPQVSKPFIYRSDIIIFNIVRLFILVWYIFFNVSWTVWNSFAVLGITELLLY